MLARMGSRSTSQPSTGMRIGTVPMMTLALTTLVLATPQTRNSAAMPGSSRPMTIGPGPMRRSPPSWPAVAASRNIKTAPMRKRMPVISVTARNSTANLLATIVDAQQAVARTIASMGMSACP